MGLFDRKIRDSDLALARDRRCWVLRDYVFPPDRTWDQHVLEVEDLLAAHKKKHGITYAQQPKIAIDLPGELLDFDISRGATAWNAGLISLPSGVPYRADLDEHPRERPDAAKLLCHEHTHTNQPRTYSRWRWRYVWDVRFRWAMEMQANACELAAMIYFRYTPRSIDNMIVRVADAFNSSRYRMTRIIDVEKITARELRRVVGDVRKSMAA